MKLKTTQRSLKERIEIVEKRLNKVEKQQRINVFGGLINWTANNYTVKEIVWAIFKYLELEIEISPAKEREIVMKKKEK